MDISIKQLFGLKCYDRVSQQRVHHNVPKLKVNIHKWLCRTYHVYQLEELMGAEGGMILLLQMLLHLNSRNMKTVTLYILPQLAFVKAIVTWLLLGCLLAETIDTFNYSQRCNVHNHGLVKGIKYAVERLYKNVE